LSTASDNAALEKIYTAETKSMEGHGQGAVFATYLQANIAANTAQFFNDPTFAEIIRRDCRT